MRLKFGTTIFDSAATSGTSTVLGTAMSGLRLWMDSAPADAAEPGPVLVSETEDAVTLLSEGELLAVGAAGGAT